MWELTDSHLMPILRVCNTSQNATDYTGPRRKCYTDFKQSVQIFSSETKVTYINKPVIFNRYY